MRFDTAQAQDAARIRHIQIPILPGHAIGRVQAVQQGVNFVGLQIVIFIQHGIYPSGETGADEKRPGGAHRHRTRAGHLVTVKGDVESGRQLDRGKHHLFANAGLQDSGLK